MNPDIATAIRSINNTRKAINIALAGLPASDLLYQYVEAFNTSVKEGAADPDAAEISATLQQELLRRMQFFAGEYNDD